MKQQFYKLFIISVIGLSAPQALSAQFWELLLEPIFIEGIYYAAFSGPNEPTWRETTFARFPYDEPNSGLFLPTTLVGDKNRFHAVAHFQSNESRTLGGLVQIKYTPISLLTAEVNYLKLFDHEQVDNTTVEVTSFSLNYNRLRLPRIHFWWGFGGIFINESDDRLEDNKAFSLNLGANYYFTKPLSLYGTMQIGEINDIIGAISEARIQVHLERYLLYAGYQDINFGDYEYSGVTFGAGIYF